MKHRLLYLLPDLTSARQARDDLLLHCIGIKQLHFMANTELPPELPEANILQKTDIVHGAEIGMFFGALLGLAFGFWLVYFPFPEMLYQRALVLAATIFGAGFGAWAASMAAAAIPNPRLDALAPEIANGKVVLFVDVPRRRINEIKQLLATHRETQFAGEDWHLPSFP